ncbi:MAG: T9SS type A sorting domain-containing protein [Bacteroidota bacterium]
MKNNLLTLCIFLLPIFAWATHNLGGSITLQHVTGSNDPNRYVITLETYTDPANANVDRCAATLVIYDENFQIVAELVDVPRSNGIVVSGGGSCIFDSTRLGQRLFPAAVIKRNLYVTEYVFPGAGNYTVLYKDVAFVPNLLNVPSPLEVNFVTKTRLTIPAAPSDESDLPIFQNHPIEYTCFNQAWNFYGGAVDLEGDSLVYELITPQTFDESLAIGTNNPSAIAGYTFPDDAVYMNGPLTIDRQTGMIDWIPNEEGGYLIGYAVVEYREGVEISRIERILTIEVRNCVNQAPVVKENLIPAPLPNEITTHILTLFDPDPTDSLYVDYNNLNQGPNGLLNPTLPDSAWMEVETWGFSTGWVSQPGLPVRVGNFSGEPSDSVRLMIRWRAGCAPPNIRQRPTAFVAHDNNLNFVGNVETRRSFFFLLKMDTLGLERPKNVLVGPTSFGKAKVNWDKVICDTLVGRYNVYHQLLSPGANLPYDSTLSPTDNGMILSGHVTGWANSEFTDLPPGYNGTQDIAYVVTAVYGLYASPSGESLGSHIAYYRGGPLSNELDLDPNIYIFPNPSSDVIYIQTKEGERLERVMLWDLQGRRLLERKAHTSREQISLKGISEGMYMLEVKGQQGVVRRMIQVNP